MAVEISRSGDGRVFTVTLRRPTARNAVDRPTADALVAAFEEFEADEQACVAVLTGGDGVFCAGADLKAVASGDAARMNRLEPPTHFPSADGPMGPTRMRLSKPVVAAIEGPAVAGGLELALWADLRVAAADAVLGVFCRRWGVPLIDGGTVRLPRLVGASRAMDLILTGRPVSADEALGMGLVNRVAPPGGALAAAQRLAAELARFPQVCMRGDRLAALEAEGLPEGAALAREWAHGEESLAHAAEGAARFAGGAGRGGAFESESPADGCRAVLFDVGGVLCSSPFVAIAQYEAELGLERNALNRAIARAGADGAWARLERGETRPAEFAAAFERECAGLGLGVGVDGAEFLRRVVGGLTVRPAMAEAVAALNALPHLRTGVLTNNFLPDADADVDDFAPELSDWFASSFDAVVESCRAGVRKPEPEAFLLACQRLDVPPQQVVFLDDIGSNLKAARALGMHTIKVPITDRTGRQSIGQLEGYLGVRLLRRVARL